MSKSAGRSPGKSPAKSNQLQMIHRALASSTGDVDKILIHGGMTGVALKGKLPQVEARFAAAKGWKLIDKTREPAWVGLPEDYKASEPVETTFSEPHRIDVEQVVQARMIVLRGKVATCFATLLNAIQPPTPVLHDPAMGTPITANDVPHRTAEVVAGRTAAVLSTDLKENDIRAQTETKEGVRRRSEKSFEEVQAATLGVFYQTFAAEVLSIHAIDLKACRFRRVYHNFIAALDGSLVGTDNSMVLVAEATAYVDCTKVGVGDNLQYMNIVCESAGLDDEKKFVLFLNGLDSSSAEHHANIAELHEKVKSLEKERAGGKRLRGQAAAANANFTGPGRGAKAAKIKDDRFFDHCKVNGHVIPDCYKMNPALSAGLPLTMRETTIVLSQRRRLLLPLLLQVRLLRASSVRSRSCEFFGIQ
ncbi:hypothetical protein B484DRAFT_434304 [Ochromonadaceae sp. CCMP2298]|nr:hypothetical protein B484DRAFT_434304 [Ochromonadaceae sp. CCMP2298]